MSRRAFGILASLLAVLGGVALASPASAYDVTPQAPAPLLDQLLGVLANPNVAYLLFVLGLLGIVAELVTAGAVFPGVLGAICLILALVGFGQMPTNWGGAALILAGIVMFVVDIKVTGWGLTVGGLIAFVLGSALIFTPFWASVTPGAPGVRLSPWVIIGTTLGVGVFFVVGLTAAIRAQFRPVAMGQQTVLGTTGTVKRALNPVGVVQLAGEEWSATAADGAVIPAGARVRVLAVDGLTLRVERAEASESRQTGETSAPFGS